MIEYSFQPTDEHINGAGHVDNVEIYRCFNEQRLALFETIGLPLGAICFPALAKTEVEFVRELFDHGPVTIRSAVSRVGSKSFTVQQTIWQDQQLCNRCETVAVYFHRHDKVTKVIDGRVRALMEKSLALFQGRTQPSST